MLLYPTPDPWSLSHVVLVSWFEMAVPGHVLFGADGTFQLTCLHFEGFLAILWDTLKWFGY